MVKIKKSHYSLKGFSKFRNKKIKTRKQNIKRGGMVNDGDGDEDEHYVGIINEEQPINNIMANYNNIMDRSLIVMDRSLIDYENNIYSTVMARKKTPYQYEDVEMVNELLLRLENRIVELNDLSLSLTDVRRVIETRVIQMLGEEGLLSERQQRSLLNDREQTMREILSERQQKKYYQNNNEDDEVNKWQRYYRLFMNERWLSLIIEQEKNVDNHWAKIYSLKELLSELLPIPDPEPEPEPKYETKDGDDDSQNGGKKNKKNKKNKSIKRQGKKV